MVLIAQSIGALYGLLAVIFGAFGAHALKKSFSDEQLKSFETGVKYQMYHALVLIMLGFNFNLDTSPAEIHGLLFSNRNVSFFVQHLWPELKRIKRQYMEVSWADYPFGRVAVGGGMGVVAVPICWTVFLNLRWTFIEHRQNPK